MNAIKRVFVDCEYGQVHARVRTPDNPKRPPLVCLHMFPQSGRMFENFMRLVNDRVVVAPDFPGHGESDPSPTPIDASEYARVIWTAVRDLGVVGDHPAVDVFGVHAGAKLAVEVAKQQRSQVRRMVLASAAAFTDAELDAFKSAFKPRPLDEEGSRFKYLWAMQVNNRGADMTLEMCAAGLAEMLRGGERYEEGHRAVFEYNRVFADALGALDQNILLLNPKDDLYVMTPRALSYMKHGELLDLPSWEHGYLDTRPQDVVETVLSWLDREITTHNETSPLAAE